MKVAIFSSFSRFLPTQFQVSPLDKVSGWLLAFPPPPAFPLKVLGLCRPNLYLSAYRKLKCPHPPGLTLANAKVVELRKGFGFWISILFVKKKKKSRIKEGLRVNTAVWPVKSSLRKSGCVKRRRNSCPKVLHTTSLPCQPLQLWRFGRLSHFSPLSAKLFLQRENCRDQFASCWPEPGRFYRGV